MKKYIDFMNEFNGDDIFEGLLGYGLFCEKLPPIFDSSNFYEYCKNNLPTFDTTCKETNYIKYESIRNTNIPRALGVPNPINYYKLCRFIGAKFVVNVDISTCFPSMYTHSLAWALAGKEYAKKNRQPSHWFNQLDFYVRGTTNGETHGLLIGPHSSNILSEIILTCVDNELTKKGWKYIRNIDDYTCFVTSNDDVQRFLVDINAELRKLNLMLNHKKTKISQLPQTSSEKWIRKLSVILTTNKKYLDYKDVKLLLDTAIELLYANNNNAAILNYVMKMIDGKQLSKNARVYYQKNILHLAIVFPYLIPLIDTYVYENQNIADEEIEDFSNIIYVEGEKTNNFEMICYALFFAVKYKFKISKISLDFILESKHCISLLLGFVYYKKVAKEKDSVKIFKELAKELIKDKDDFEENWLFVYEVLTVGFFKGDNSDWKILKKNGISFLKEDIV